MFQVLQRTLRKQLKVSFQNYKKYKHQHRIILMLVQGYSYPECLYQLWWENKARLSQKSKIIWIAQSLCRCHMENSTTNLLKFQVNLSMLSPRQSAWSMELYIMGSRTIPSLFPLALAQALQPSSQRIN